MQARGYEEINVPITVDKIELPLFEAYFLLVGVAIILAQFCSLVERKSKVHQYSLGLVIHSIIELLMEIKLNPSDNKKVCFILVSYGIFYCGGGGELETYNI